MFLTYTFIIQVGEVRAGGAGSSMTGNVGRLLLQHGAVLAPILLPSLRQETGQAVLDALGEFWIALQCGYVVHPEKFGALCNHVDHLLRTYVDWHPIVPSIHLDLIHGQQLAEHFFPIPLGWLSEEALESHNKLEKRFRQDHTAKNSRQKVMETLINRSLDGSDPLVLEASLEDRLKFRRQHSFDSLPQVVKDMVMDHPYNSIR